MGYYNPIYIYPRERFLDDAEAAGVDGLIIVDLPPEADDELCLPAIERGLNFIRLATPTTDAKRLPAVLRQHLGLPLLRLDHRHHRRRRARREAVHAQVARIRKSTKLPVAVGFGVRTPEQATAIAAGADAVVVGSALVNAIRTTLGPKGEPTGKTVPNVLDLVKSLCAGVAHAVSASAKSPLRGASNSGRMASD